MTQASFEAFYQHVLREPALQATLREISERTAFVQRVVALGKELGYAFSEETVASALQAQRRAWNERWLR